MVNSSLIEKVWSYAAQDPEKVVVKDVCRLWTWRDLLWRADAYSKALIESGDEASVVPIMVNRSGESVAAILGVILTGRGFAPLSSKQPPVRLLHCLQALNAKNIILTDGKTNSEIDPLRSIILKDQVSAQGLPEAPRPMLLQDILYVLFTSGSTGVPKGVMADFGNIENTMLWSEDMLDWRSEDVIGCCTNFFFDISMFDLFSLFYFGVPLAIYSNPPVIATVLEETFKFGITSAFSVPTFFCQILRQGMAGDKRLSKLRRIISGGDFFPPVHVLGWREIRPDIDIYNVWGPTETSIVNTMHRITDIDLPFLLQGKSPSVGKTHPRMQLCLIDEAGLLFQEPNRRGEICMLGECVTRGYLGDLKGTEKAYIKIMGARAFRTQDIGYFDEDGALFIVGRIGATVKISGYRIDLGEVDTLAVTIDNIHLACCCVVETKRGSGNTELWLVLEPESHEQEVDIYSIKKALRGMLPSYMVPKKILVVSNLPQNANGKIDRGAVLQYAVGQIKE